MVLQLCNIVFHVRTTSDCRIDGPIGVILRRKVRRASFAARMALIRDRRSWLARWIRTRVILD